ncbi:putative reverse transcriptase domain-containing protein [Tanacetum coccineum]
MCWESGMRVNIPNFDGNTLNPEGFIDWLVVVEEVFEFKEVLENKRVSLIATKLCGRASAWWQQLNQTRENNGVADDDYEEPLVFDDDQYEEEIVSGDVGVNLMVRRSCLTPKVVGDDWLKHNIFQSTCTILGKVCTFVVDTGSCNNLIAKEEVQKLGLKTENRPKHYKLQWLKKGGKVTISKRVLTAFFMGTTYKDSVWCDVVPMDAYHLLLGDDIFVLIGKEVAKDSKIPKAMIPLLEEFFDVFPDELPDGLPPLRDIQHHIDLESGS